MKHLHVVNPYGSAAMRRMTYPITAELHKLYEITESEAVDTTADLNFHMPWHTLVGLQDKGEGKHVIAYTHCNPPDRPALLDACERADLITCMSYEGRRELVEMGVDPKKLWVVYAAADLQYRKRLIGIVGYPQPNGRKRESIIMDLAWRMDLSPFQFLFVGGDWESFVEQLQMLGVSANCIHAETPQMLTDIYNRLDLLLVTGYVEGGPLPLLEAMAAGVRVLSPRFGYAADLLDESDLYDGLDELQDALMNYVAGGIYYHQLARAWNWIDYANEYALLFGRLTGESVDLYPERGMSRYAQILDIIDEVKPKDIAEIGTWNGHNAARMIQQAAKYHRIEDVYYQGFDLFEGQTGEQFRRELSKHGWLRSVVEKKLDATSAFIMLEDGDTNKTIERASVTDLYFIDGGHSEETIENDADGVLASMHDGSVIVFDDYYHEGKPEGCGCNKVIDNLSREQYEVTFLPILTHADDGRLIGMVKVRRHANLYLQMSETAHAGSATYSIAGYSELPGQVRLPKVPSWYVAGSASRGGELERTSAAS